MSDHWETFPCQMGEHQAFVTYDHGVRDEIDGLPLPNCARFEVVLRNPDDRGLPQGEEFEALNKIEDRFAEEMGENVAINVGRVTTSGRRYLFFYTQLDEAAASEIGSKVAFESGYEVALSFHADPDRDGYWKQLFPSADDWQVIQDIRVEDSLRESGDALTEPRPITHWAYFPREEDRQKFLATVAHIFEDVDVYETPDCDRGIHTARLTHIGLPDHRSMNSTTLLLSREASQAGGDYDGWETEVRKR